MKKNFTTIFVMLVFAITMQVKAQSKEKDVTTIELIQTKGKFETEKLQLLSGKYQFRIFNENVEKDLGFVIQKSEDAKKDVMKTAIPNSYTTQYVKKGKAAYTGVVKLTKGEYVYSCPLNPTPHYIINVK